MNDQNIRIESAFQNNLKNIDVSIPLGDLTVITGVSGSGKSSLAFDILYAEGQRRYVETFSPYARQFLDRMDKPNAERILNIPPAIAINQTNPVKSSRSTVGTMSEINDYVKLLFARAGKLHCRSCGRRVKRDTASEVFRDIMKKYGTPEGLILFPVPLSGQASWESLREVLISQGFLRILTDGKIADIRETDNAAEGEECLVVLDRTKFEKKNRKRVTDSLESAFRAGGGHIACFIDGNLLRFSVSLHCADCDIEYTDPVPNLFSFNNPLGACPVCHGFGRIIDVDPRLVIPDESRSLQEGAIKPWTTKAAQHERAEMLRFCRSRGIPADVPWKSLPEKHRDSIYNGGEGFYGVKGFFKWLETKTYKMHVRVFLAKYRMYSTCPSCGGSRYNGDSLLYTIDGMTVADFGSSPISNLYEFTRELSVSFSGNKPVTHILNEIHSRLSYLCRVGLGYLTLGRQSRTLSGGEVARVKLTTALGTSLVNTLYVLDEPSIGLHPSDTRKLVDVLCDLRDASNTVVVVEHDPEIITAADSIIDLGPGPGEKGGTVMYSGNSRDILKSPDSVTGLYLSGRERIPVPRERRKPEKGVVSVRGAREHNLKNLDLDIPAGCMVCVTGVSGSGKSTLVHDVLYTNIAHELGQTNEEPGRCDSVSLPCEIEKTELVDQSSILKSPRSVIVTYVKGYQHIRSLFSTAQLSLKRGYDAGTFSFNTDKGRCSACKGSGFETVEMQFLADVHVPCPECGGKRFTPEVLEVKYEGKTIDDVLSMTVQEAVTFFGEDSPTARALLPLSAVGLGYITLGQPLNTLSGGESQRLKLAGHMKTGSSRTLFLFDEPTTGLHLDDIRTLLEAFSSLIDQGNSLVVIEHNMDVVKCADYVIDLGPGGGENGGRITAEGTPEEICTVKQSVTGRHLKPYLKSRGYAMESRAGYRPNTVPPPDDIIIRGAREHNLADIDVSIPLDSFTVVTGISGSGKSTLAFDILFAEGQRRYMDSLSAYVRQYLQQLNRPETDLITGIPPSVAIEQRIARGGRRSTVATVTELYHFMRLLFSKLGIQHCPDCSVRIEPRFPESIGRDLIKRFRGKKIELTAPMVRSKKGFHRDIAEWAVRHGYNRLYVDGAPAAADAFPDLSRYEEHTIDLVTAVITVPARLSGKFRKEVEETLRTGDGVLKAVYRGRDYVYSTRRSCPQCGRSFLDPDPRMFSFNSPLGQCRRCRGLGKLIKENRKGDIVTVRECPECGGTRLNHLARCVRVGEYSITDISAMSVEEAGEYFGSMQFGSALGGLAAQIQKEMIDRISFLEHVGLSYLTLDRGADTLSTGEAQRIRLAAQLGSNLRGVCYILDEPTIGLHPRDNDMLIQTLSQLRDRGNTVVVVEHDESTIRAADYVIDLGPGAGVNGGEIVGKGSPASLKKEKRSVTGRMLSYPAVHPLNGKRRDIGKTPRLTVRGASENNLKRIDAGFPINRFTCVTGVSGSGKSSLVRDVLFEGVTARLSGKKTGRNFDEIAGMEEIARAVEVDQSPIGRTPRSTPATYIGMHTVIRELFSLTRDARIRGYTPSRFSFNVKGGRCEQCGGQGRIKTEMNFLPDVYVPCPECGGKRYNRETLEILYNGLSISDVLDLTAAEALRVFDSIRKLKHPLELMNKIGLDYLTLGQTSPTLSGGEAQRIKLVSELSKTGQNATLYVLEEPTTGLHTSDVVKLIRIIHELVDRGNTVVVIEHNLDVIAEADYIIDLGPEGGENGGTIIAEGTPEQVCRVKKSETGKYLKRLLERK